VSEQGGRTIDLHDGETEGLAIVAGGMLALVLGWIVHSRVLRVIGFLAAAAGSSLYARAKLAERSEKIDSAESHIRSELDDLDPLAKAEVIAKLARPE
jgi:hypothetical protein